ncbi:family 43 glycosylhydrolase [Streptomyces sp. L2]|uniref:family 43 glycosylhydrolase n=1 Tax=Streptomyces sp. L2 TaxID=2162665 RepID=UPI001011C85D|nr:family 43 glycosylhydrolase [Streptomyces sp. L2]
MSRALHIVLRLAVAFFLGFLLPLQAADDAAAAAGTFTNGTQFINTAGDAVHGHGGSMIKVDGYYYWFGENTFPNGPFASVPIYRSSDLRTWEFRNSALVQSSAPELQRAGVYRPRVIYNASTHQYVLFVRKENYPSPMTENKVAVATSPTVDGTYTYRGSFRPMGYKSFDMTVFRDTDGRAYLISTTNGQKDQTIFRLAPDYLSVAARVTTLHGVAREAQSVFKRNGVYFMVSSGTTGWNPNQQKYTTATSMAGPWSGQTNLGDSIGYGSQVTSIVPVQGSRTTSYLYMGDRWAQPWHGVHNDSEYVWLPLRFPTNRSLWMPYHPRVFINTDTGVVSGVGWGNPYQELRAQHSGQCLTALWSWNDGAGVTQRPCGNAQNTNQHWQLLPLDDGYYRIIDRHNHKCLTVPNSVTNDGAWLTQQTCGVDWNQQWQFTSIGGGSWRITARHSGKSLTITAGPRAVQYSWRGTANQKWQQVRAPY